ncbi:MAG: DNA topoisomerase IV subunit A [Victivallaceae bacterium]|nr:DNA topoisomerase IV subunit A [Victivallaceae bacterium]
MAEEKSIPTGETVDRTELDDQELREVEELGDAEALAEGESEAVGSDQQGSNSFLRRMMEENFIEYASYVIKERAIPDVDDGLKPVQRRILWSLFRMHDGKFHKVANVIGHTMQYHPHGDASIGDALVVLSNKEYFLDKQGNFGNILTGDMASAARYIECRLSPLGLEVLFNNDITEFIGSYDGRNQEPIVLPVKIPSLLMLGTDGIAVGMSTKILPHNFCELLEAQIAVLQGRSFELYPDFPQGGSMDVSEYDRGNGKVKLRAKIDHDGRKLIIREIPAATTTESLIASIEHAVEKNKIKIAAVNDYTAENVEIEIVPTRGQDPQKMLKALYAYTDCSVSVSCNMMVIRNGLPAQMDVDSVLRRNTEKLLDYLQRELEIELARLEELFHAKTLAEIFIENRIYQRIEDCESFEKVMAAVYEGLAPFRDRLKREVNDDDIQKLLAIPIRRISLFDLRKNREELDDILKQLEQVKKNLGNLKTHAIRYLRELLKKYGERFPRRTEIDQFKKIDRRAVALNNIKVGWDRKGCYIGTNVKSDDVVTCNEFDHLLGVERKGDYKVINIPEKIFTGRLYDFRKFDPAQEFGVIYKEEKTGKYYAKRTVIDKFIVDREYRLCPKNCRLEVFTPRPDSVYTLLAETRRGAEPIELNLQDYPLRSPKARGLLISSKPITKISHLRYLLEDELKNSEPEKPAAESETVEVIPETETEAPAAPETVSEVIEVESEAAIPRKISEKPKIGKKSSPKSEVKPNAETTLPAAPEPGRGKIEVEPETSPKVRKKPGTGKRSAPKPETGPNPEAPPKPKPKPASGKKPKAGRKSVPRPEIAPEAKATAEVPPEPASRDEKSKDTPKESDEWGIVQPEFGF